MSQAGHLEPLLKPYVWHGDTNVVTRSVSDVPPRHQERRQRQNPPAQEVLHSVVTSLVSSRGVDWSPSRNSFQHVSDDLRQCKCVSNADTPNFVHDGILGGLFLVPGC